MTDPTWDDLQSNGRDRRRDVLRGALWVVLGLVFVVGLVVGAVYLLADDSRDALYRQAQKDSRSIGPTNGRLDDGSIVGAVTFFDESGTVCTLFGPPGERSDDLYCVTDTSEEVDAVNWKIDPDNNVELTVMIVDGESPHIGYEFEGTTPGHAIGWFPIPKPAVVAVYVGPPWESLDIDTTAPA